MLSKFIGFIVTGSSSMLAETLHSLADSFNQILLLFGEKRSRRRANKTHQFGYGKERYFYSFIVALTIFIIGGAFAIKEGYSKLLHLHKSENLTLAILILFIAVVLESYSLRTAIRESNRERGKLSWGNYIKLNKSPELPVVLLEDIAALIGLIIALISILLSYVTGDPKYDAIGTILIGVLLILIASVLIIEMKSLLLGESIIPSEEATVRKIINGYDFVKKINELRTLHISPEIILLAVKITINENTTVKDSTNGIKEIEKNIKKINKKIKYIYIEVEDIDLIEN